MPKELRKRGKKKKSQQVREEHTNAPPPPPQPAEPAWVIQAPKHAEEEEVNLGAPFGEVDADVKAYFRTVDVQIRDWQDSTEETGNAEDTDPNEERRMFFVAALTEMAGKEKQLATDPECSLVLERMSYSMDDFVRRVFVDSLVGSYSVLVKHRFASHVCQTLLTIASQTISREQRGILPTVPEGGERGELRTLTQLIVDVCEELVPVFTTLITDPFASHVIRALLLLLSPNLAASHESAQNTTRSKKSAKWKARQGPLKSVFKDSSNAPAAFYTPPKSFTDAARKFVEVVRAELDENETRSLTANKVASPTLQMLLAVEADQQMTEDHDSLMDRVLVRLISSSRANPTGTFPASDYIVTLLRDPTSSHLLETIVTKCPESAFSILWKVYFKDSLPKIALHPVANFVLAKALERLDEAQLSDACAELQDTWGRMIQTSRTGVFRAIIDRAAVLQACGSEVREAVWTAFQTKTDEERNLLVPCMLFLQSVQEYKSTRGTAFAEGESKRDSENELPEAKVQGAVLLQSLLRLPEPLNDLVINSLNSLPIEEVLAISKQPVSSRVLDAFLDSPTVPPKTKRQLLLSLIGSYHLLVDDRIGSRVGDRCWAFADTYLKEKIARSLIPEERFLAGSYYGKFFARNLNLYLLQRRPDEWRTIQAGQNRPVTEPAKPATHPPNNAIPTSTAPSDKPKKRKREVAKDEIDELFTKTVGKKVKKAALTADVQLESGPSPLDAGLSDVMRAIRAAPTGAGAAQGRGRRKG